MAHTVAENLHLQLVRRAGCAVGNRGFGGCDGRLIIHHIASGSGVRSHFATVCLCQAHHKDSGIGFHDAPRSFLRLYRPPGESEYGLLVWANEDMALFRMRDVKLLAAPI